MNKKKFAEAMSMVDDKYYEEAANYQRKKKTPVWLRWGALAACLFLVAAWVLELPRLNRQNGDEGGGLSNTGKQRSDNVTIGPAHREDFSPEISPEAASLFQGVPGVLKVYRTTADRWFLSDQMTDYSQAQTGEAVYVVPNYSEGIDHAPTGDQSYGIYVMGEDSRLIWGEGAVLHEKHTMPYELIGLSDEIILQDLSGIGYDDYIITQSTLLYTVIVWARCPGGNDRFVTYSSRPEFVDLEDHAVHTLEELQQRLANSQAGGISTSTYLDDLGSSDG